MKTYEGKLTAAEGRFAIVASRFNRLVVDRLVEGAREGLVRHGITDGSIDLYWVPGAVELALTAQKLAEGGKHAAVLCLGCVVKGDTDHYDYVCSAATNGITKVGLDNNLPVIFGVLTCNTMEQALDRAGGKAGNKGFDAATTAIEMVNLLRSI